MLEMQQTTKRLVTHPVAVSLVAVRTVYNCGAARFGDSNGNAVIVDALYTILGVYWRLFASSVGLYFYAVEQTG